MNDIECSSLIDPENEETTNTGLTRGIIVISIYIYIHLETQRKIYIMLLPPFFVF